MESVRIQRQKAKLTLAQLDHELKHFERHHNRPNNHPLTDFIHSKAWIFLLLMHSFSDVCKHLSQYSLQHINGGSYPVDKTVLVLASEGLKMLVISIILLCRLPLSRTQIFTSWRFAILGLLYVILNNLHLLALTLVTPIVWIVLASVKTVIIALVYKFLLSRAVNAYQFGGVFLITVGIILIKVPDLLQYHGLYDDTVTIAYDIPNSNDTTMVSGEREKNLPVSAIFLALLSSSLAVCTSIYVELIFKGSSSPSTAPPTPTKKPLLASTPSKPQLDVLDTLGGGEDRRHQLWNTSFLDQQFWLYLYGLFVSLCAQFFINEGSIGAEEGIRDILELSPHMLFLLLTAVVSDAMSGLLVACILLKLDNVAKEYSAAASNVVLALLCAKIFPEQFQLNAWVILSLGFLLSGVVVYERNRKKKDIEHDMGQFQKLKFEAV